MTNVKQYDAATIALGRDFFISNHFGKDFAKVLSSVGDDEFLALGKACVVVSSGDGELSKKEKEYIIGSLAFYGASPKVLNEVNSFDAKTKLGQLVSDFKTFDTKFVLWHAIVAAAIDGLDDGEVKQFEASAKELGESPDVVQRILELQSKSHQSFLDKMTACFPTYTKESVDRKAASKPTDNEDDAIHIADSKVFAGRDEKTAVFDKYDDAAAIEAAQAFFFLHEWGMQTAPPDEAFVPFNSAILACCAGDGVISEEERKALVGLASAQKATNDHIQELKVAKTMEIDSAKIKSTLVPHQYPIVAYYAILCASADGEFPPEEKQQLVKLFSETFVDEKHIDNLEKAYNDEKKVAGEIAQFVCA